MEPAINWMLARVGKVSYSMEHRNGPESYDCLPLDSTELLTPTGWKPLSEFAVGDDVVQYDVKTNKLSPTKVMNVVEPYMAEVTRRGDFEATDSHRVLYRTKKTNYIREALWGDIKDSYSVITPDMTTMDKPHTALNDLSDDEFKLLVAIQADGHYKKISGNTTRVHFHLSKKRKINRLLDLLESIGLTYTIYDELKDDTAQITIDDNTIIDNFAEKYLKDKTFTEDWVNIDEHKFDVFFHELYKWDGTDYGARKLFGSTNKKDVDTVQAVFTVNGVKSTQRKIVDNRSENYSDYYVLTYYTNPSYSLGQKISTRETMVSCISVESTYIVARVNGTPFITGNCSSAVYHALKAAGILPASTPIGWTGRMFSDLPAHGFSEIPADANGTIDAQRGDIFLWLISGDWTTPGGGAHTGIFINPNDIVHCNFSYGMSINNHDAFASAAGVKQLRVFRYRGGNPPAPTVPNNPVDQDLEVDSWVRFDGIYQVDDMQIIDGVWRVRSNVLCKRDFTWSDNGVPVEPLVEVDRASYATPDQDLNVGELFKIPGKYRVLDLGKSDTSEQWMAKLHIGGMDCWIDVEPMTEISENDAGTPQPLKKQVEAPKNEQTESSQEPQKQPETNNQPSQDLTPPAEPGNEQSEQKPKDGSGEVEKPAEIGNKPLILTEEQMAQLEKFQENINKQVGDAEYSPTISTQVKDKVYFATDIGIALAGMVAVVTSVFIPSRITEIFAVAGAITAFLGNMKIIFKLSSKK